MSPPSPKSIRSIWATDGSRGWVCSERRTLDVNSSSQSVVDEVVVICIEGPPSRSTICAAVGRISAFSSQQVWSNSQRLSEQDIGRGGRFPFKMCNMTAMSFQPLNRPCPVNISIINSILVSKRICNPGVPHSRHRRRRKHPSRSEVFVVRIIPGHDSAVSLRVL